MIYSGLAMSKTSDKLKRCPKCKISKPTNEFYKNRQAKDGLCTYCKTCLKAVVIKRNLQKEQRKKNKKVSDFATEIGYLVQEGESSVDCKRQGINTWEQADSAIREMAELQATINKEIEGYNTRAKQNETNTISVLKFPVVHQARLKYMLKMFVKSCCRNGEKIIRQSRFGILTFHGGKMDIVLGVALAEERAEKS